VNVPLGATAESEDVDRRAGQANLSRDGVDINPNESQKTLGGVVKSVGLLDAVAALDSAAVASLELELGLGSRSSRDGGDESKSEGNNGETSEHVGNKESGWVGLRRLGLA
jgi:hypothetical protein